MPGARCLEAAAVGPHGQRLYEVTAEFRGREIDITFGGDGNVIETDGLPDPGEVCWAWVPYEEDETRGKDRPVLLLALDGTEWLAL